MSPEAFNRTDTPPFTLATCHSVDTLGASSSRACVTVVCAARKAASTGVLMEASLRPSKAPLVHLGEFWNGRIHRPLGREAEVRRVAACRDLRSG